MKIQNFSQLGKRSNNEDSFGVNDALITVCDGMGGHVSGERASSFVVKSMLEVFTSQQSIGKMDIQKQLDNVQLNMNELLKNEPELEKMGTTFTGIFMTPDVWYAAHIGDSRIYLFRPSEKKLWHTWDHSLVGELMRTHEITCEGGRFHPMSNRISKAIIARKGGTPVSASIVKIDNLKAGDIFLLCSDGVVEGCSDVDLVNIFSDENKNFEQKCASVRMLCGENSKDNNTAVMIEIEPHDEFSYGNNDELSWTSFDEVFADYDKYMKESQDDEAGYSIEMEQKPAAEAKTMPSEQNKDSVSQHTPTCQLQTSVTQRDSSGKVVVKRKNSTRLKRLVFGIVIVAIAVLAALLVMKKCSGKPEGKKHSSATTEQQQKIEDKNSKEPKQTQSGKKEESKSNQEQEAFAGCTTLENCRNYIAEYPDGKFANQVKDTIKKLDNQRFNACNSVEDYDNYLRDFPNGENMQRAKLKKGELEKASKDGINDGEQKSEESDSLGNKKSN